MSGDLESPSKSIPKGTLLAIVVTGLVYLSMAVLLGDLNAIAPVITMFFMLTYGTINLACFYESITRNPSYRPAFRFSH